MYYPYYYDPTYIILIPAIILTMYAQFKVSSTTNRYFRVRTQRGYTGEQTAREILNANGIYDVRIEMTRGTLSDHYDPRNKILRLSQDVYRGTSITSVAVAAHECGHAIQDQEDYVPLRFRSAFVPVANLGTQVAFPILLLGVFLGSSHFLIQVGLLCFFFGVLFQLITLPVEFNASGRAVRILRETGMMSDDELSKTKKVLSAAAMTYVAAAAASILSMLRLIILFGGNRRRD